MKVWNKITLTLSLYLIRHICLMSEVAISSCCGASPLSPTLLVACRFTFCRCPSCPLWPSLKVSSLPPGVHLVETQCRGVSLLLPVLFIFALSSIRSSCLSPCWWVTVVGWNHTGMTASCCIMETWGAIHVFSPFFGLLGHQWSFKKSTFPSIPARWRAVFFSLSVVSGLALAESSRSTPPLPS